MSLPILKVRKIEGSTSGNIMVNSYLLGVLGLTPGESFVTLDIESKDMGLGMQDKALIVKRVTDPDVLAKKTHRVNNVRITSRLEQKQYPIKSEEYITELGNNDQETITQVIPASEEHLNDIIEEEPEQITETPDNNSLLNPEAFPLTEEQDAMNSNKTNIFRFRPSS